MKKIKRIVTVILSFVMVFSLWGCGKVAEEVAEKSAFAESGEDMKFPEGVDKNIYDFTVEFLKASAKEGTNSMVSPVSVLMAMCMAENGAAGETLAQMEEAFGCSAEDLGYWLKSYDEITEGTDKTKVNIANSLWINDTDEFNVEEDYIKKVKFYFNAEIEKIPFNDKALKKINKWCSENTYGMIDKIIDEISPENMTYIINAVAFDGEWQKKYEGEQIKEEEFTAEDGQRQDAEMMYSQESQYLEDENAVGFLKPYKDGYSFAAFLPNEDISINDYLNTLTGKNLSSLLENAKEAEVHAVLPQFKSEYAVDNMIDIFKGMGISDLFDAGKANLSALGKAEGQNLYVDEIIHKTYIDVNANGTKAAAVTSITMKLTSMAPDQKEIYYVRLDRPFVYAIIDDETMTPVFIGTVVNLGD